MRARLVLIAWALAAGCDPSPPLLDADQVADGGPRDASGVDGGGIDAGGLDGGGFDGGSPDGGVARCGAASRPSLSGVSLTRVDAVPVRDGFAPGWGIVEGPVWVGDALLVSHFGAGATPESRLYRVASDGTVSVARTGAGTNGLARAPDGRIYGASHAVGGIVAFDPSDLSRAPVTLVASYEGARLNGPNDLVVRSDGTIYFTDPDYQAPRPRPQSATRVYRLAPGGTLEVIAADLSQPNGIALSLDERTLFVGHGGGLVRYPLDAAGAVSGPRAPFGSLSGGVDGLGRDCAGDLYVTNRDAVVVLDPSGAELGRLPAVGATNVAFGGADGRTLYVTALGDPPALYMARLEVAGLPD